MVFKVTQNIESCGDFWAHKKFEVNKFNIQGVS